MAIKNRHHLEMSQESMRVALGLEKDIIGCQREEIDTFNLEFRLRMALESAAEHERLAIEGCEDCHKGRCLW